MTRSTNTSVDHNTSGQTQCYYEKYEDIYYALNISLTMTFISIKMFQLEIIQRDQKMKRY